MGLLGFHSSAWAAENVQHAASRAAASAARRVIRDLVALLWWCVGLGVLCLAGIDLLVFSIGQVHRSPLLRFLVARPQHACCSHALLVGVAGTLGRAPCRVRVCQYV